MRHTLDGEYADAEIIMDCTGYKTLNQILNTTKEAYFETSWALFLKLVITWHVKGCWFTLQYRPKKKKKNPSNQTPVQTFRLKAISLQHLLTQYFNVLI